MHKGEEEKRRRGETLNGRGIVFVSKTYFFQKTLWVKFLFTLNILIMKYLTWNVLNLMLIANKILITKKKFDFESQLITNILDSKTYFTLKIILLQRLVDLKLFKP